ncbi:MAG: hypothetical protein ACO3XI_16445, partial [bacterium]
RPGARAVRILRRAGHRGRRRADLDAGRLHPHRRDAVGDGFGGPLRRQHPLHHPRPDNCLSRL